MKTKRLSITLLISAVGLVLMYQCCFSTHHVSKTAARTSNEQPVAVERISKQRAVSTLTRAIPNMMNVGQHSTAANTPDTYHKHVIKAKTANYKRLLEIQKRVKLQRAMFNRTTSRHTAESVPREINKCLSLAPKMYVQNEARNFTMQELRALQDKSGDPLIPRIIHQTWDTYDIPRIAEPYVRSIVEQHADWQYWFWTEADIRCYMQTHHPEYMELFNSYPATIFRTDVMRYFVLYDYGGFYTDLDVECLQPLDAWTNVAYSLLSHETYEHTYFGHMRQQPNVMTTVLATKARHPYYKLLQENLQRYHDTCPNNVLYSTGPFYIDNIYQKYVQDHGVTSREDNITIIHPR